MLHSDHRPIQLLSYWIFVTFALIIVQKKILPSLICLYLLLCCFSFLYSVAGYFLGCGIRYFLGYVWRQFLGCVSTHFLGCVDVILLVLFDDISWLCLMSFLDFVYVISWLCYQLFSCLCLMLFFGCVIRCFLACFWRYFLSFIGRQFPGSVCCHLLLLLLVIFLF